MGQRALLARATPVHGARRHTHAGGDSRGAHGGPLLSFKHPIEIPDAFKRTLWKALLSFKRPVEIPFGFQGSLLETN
jgi:hypothetical protein